MLGKNQEIFRTNDDGEENDLPIQQLNYENKCEMALSVRKALAEQIGVQLGQLPTLTILDQ
jgi:hypothetical protein